MAACAAFKVVLLLLGGISIALVGEAAQAFDIRDQTVLKSVFALIGIIASVAAAAFAGTRVWALVLAAIESRKAPRSPVADTEE